MSVLSVRLYPDPVLTRRCEPIRHWGEALQQMVTDLTDTLKAQPGGLGIASPQVGRSVRLILVDVSRKQQAHGRLVLVNPVIVRTQGSVLSREGCMSLPDYTANVRRAECVTVSAYTVHGEPFQLESEGLESVCLQHEIDHLDGLLFIHRVANLRTDVFRRKRYL